MFPEIAVVMADGKGQTMCHSSVMKSCLTRMVYGVFGELAVLQDLEI